MAALTEDEIKSAFLPYLKEFYRFRYEYQPGTEKSSVDNITQEGYVADGMLSFKKPDGRDFFCTFEATSADKIEEVQFSLNFWYFIWDCLGFAGLVATFAYGLLYITNEEFIGNLTWSGKIGMPVGIGIIAYFTWYFLMRGWKKYRYIYAIEQFKRYHADEQWVALAEDVFPSITSPYFLELKDQCVYHGIGLALVYPDFQVRPMAAPSRLGIFGRNRKMAHWLTDTRLYQSMASNMRAATAFRSGRPGFVTTLYQTIMRPVHRFFLQPIMKALGKTAQPATDIYKRFTGEFLIQKWVFTLSLIITAAISYNSKKHQDIVELARRPEIYKIEEPVESPEHDNRFVRNTGEIAIPFGETITPESFDGIPRQTEETLKNRPTTENTTSGINKKAPLQVDKAASSKQETKTTTIEKPASVTKVATKKSAGLCDKIRKAGGWYIQDNRFSLEERAKIRVTALTKAGIDCDYFNGSCLGIDGWVVRLGTNLYTEKAAREAAVNFAVLLEKAKLKTGIPLQKKVTE